MAAFVSSAEYPEQARQVSKAVDGLNCARNVSTDAVEPDTAQTRGGCSTCDDLELVTDVDNPARWHAKTTGGQLKDPSMGLGDAELL